LELDALGAVFVLVAGLTGAAASLFGIGYTAHGLDARSVQAVYPLFVLTLLLVPMAGSVATLLMCWEVMAVSSLVLVAAEHRQREEVRTAAWWYAAMTQLSFVGILVGLLVLAAGADGETFAALRLGAAALSPAAQGVVFVTCLAGFWAKAGLVPLHVWLPRAHPEAPSHVSALMSGVMVKLGLYGILRVGWDLLGGGPVWWGLLVMTIGAVSALFGILHALVSTDLKRLLAYSTTENVGLVAIGVGAAGVYASVDAPALAAVAATAALLHVVNHAVFKGVLFLGAGSVLTATGTRDLDRLGGLLRRMPVTGATFAVGALAIAALPPLNGFVSEWLLLRSLVHAVADPPTVLAVAMPVGVGVVALTGGLAVTTFVKALGTGFLALPRSTAAEAAAESPSSMRAGLVLLAAGCVALGVVPGPALWAAARAAALPPFLDGPAVTATAGVLRTAALGGSLAPGLLGLGLVAAVGLVVAVRRLAARPYGTPRVAENWACGRTVQTARMEYTATSFAEPLQRVFDDVLRPDTDLTVTHRAESRYYLEAARYRQGISDGFETRLYQPVIAAFRWLGRQAGAIQNGSVQRYVAYGFVTLVVLLVVSR
jgi:formate hydrogenlyase subunit 3/multisubunit Na+/H+ antiporter MnhD subunit